MRTECGKEDCQGGQYSQGAVGYVFVLARQDLSVWQCNSEGANDCNYNQLSPLLFCQLHLVCLTKMMNYG